MKKKSDKDLFYPFKKGRCFRGGSAKIRSDQLKCMKVFCAPPMARVWQYSMDTYDIFTSDFNKGVGGGEALISYRSCMNDSALMG